MTGGLPPEIVHRFVRRRLGAIRRCYDKGLKTSPTLAGSVQLRFVIRSDGSVSNLATSGDLNHTTVESCIGQAVSTLRFPRPEGGAVTVSYPLLLSLPS